MKRKYLVRAAMAVMLPAALWPGQVIAGNKNPSYGGYDGPAGSYKDSCNTEVRSTTMVAISAQCRKKSGTFVKAAIAYHRCYTGSIRNNDGSLECDLDPNTDAQDGALRNAATPALNSAAIIVFGQPMTPMYDIYMFRLRRDGSPYIGDIGAQTFDFTQAAKFLRSELVNADKSTWDGVIGRAFQQARKRSPTPAELSKYETQIAAGKAWYSSIVIAEKTP